jgi:hypothetical protein
MKQDEIIELARKAGFDEHHAKFDTRIKVFAKLIAKYEREACAKICENLELPFVADAIHARKNK